MQTLTMTMPVSHSPDATPASTSVDVSPAQDRVAFTILVREHHRPLLAYARALVSDSAASADLLQETLLTAYRILHTFDATADFAAWVRGIMRNKWREQARQRKWETLSDDLLEGIDAQHATWTFALKEAQEKNPLFARLEECLQKLPALLREAVDACYYRSNNAEEAASDAGINPATMRKRLERARTALRQCIETPDAQLTADC